MKLMDMSAWRKWSKYLRIYF